MCEKETHEQDELLKANTHTHGLRIESLWDKMAKYQPDYNDS